MGYTSEKGVKEMARKSRVKKEKKVRQLEEQELLVRDLKLMGLWFTLAVAISGILAFAVHQVF